MSSARTRALQLWCAATDRTFRITDARSGHVLAGKCIHCNAVLSVPLAPGGPSGATLEHIVPRVHGGGNSLDNLALACGRCNGGKGVRLDARRWDDPTLQAVIATLQARRAERMRPPLDGLVLPPWPFDPPPGSDDRGAAAPRPTRAADRSSRGGRGRGRGER